MKKEKGITLIALVITIIVLLILAGVSIAMLTGENGIITQAQKAKENTEQAAKNEMAIALVITIIVLLILAGVSIAMLTGENGIITQAQKAKENTEQAAKNEMAALNSIEDYLSEQTGGGYLKNKQVEVT